MSDRRRIDHPRHLFPEVAAFFIELQRIGLRVKWALTEEFDWFPAWTFGSATGVAGIMLAVMLFFFAEPPPQAAEVKPDPIIIPQPEVVLNEPQPVMPTAVPNLPNYTSSLTASTLSRTFLPYDWRQEELVTTTSKPRAENWQLTQRIIPDNWRTMVPFRQQQEVFTPYALRGQTVPIAPSTLTTASSLSPLQNPNPMQELGLWIDKTVVPQASVGQPVTYQIHLRNTSPNVIHDVMVRERLSAIHRVSDVSPSARQVGDELVWSLGNMRSGEQKILTVSVVPSSMEQLIHTETELRSSSQVITQATAVNNPVQDIIPQPIQPKPEPPPQTVKEPEPRPFPELKLAVTPLKVLKKGDVLSLVFTVSNIGNAAAEDVTLFVRLSDQFEHRYGDVVKHHIVKLEPGESRKALLQATAKVPGEAKLDASLTMGTEEEDARNWTIPIQNTPDQVTSARLKSPDEPKKSKPIQDSCVRPVHCQVYRPAPHEPTMVASAMSTTALD